MENKCTHYNERPVTCRQFPFSLDLDPEEGVLLGIDMNCPEAVELVNESDGNIEFPDRDSAEKLLALKQLALVNPRRVWIFDLGSEKWARYDKVG
jgi:Fe-S-cluster containining protein